MPFPQFMAHILEDANFPKADSLMDADAGIVGERDYADGIAVALLAQNGDERRV